ncbi:MAG: hypothetical protein VKK42_27675 [Lyngbya sp.]|nr:hypothetical protein [Lyngbya sp.]
MITMLRFLLKSEKKRVKGVPSQSTDGFTMIELLVGAIVAFLIIGPLLGFVVSILNDDTREQVKTTTDYELQAAVDFISEDLSQAYHIYNPDEIETIKPQLPQEGTPILVFWKLHRLPDSVPLPGTTILPNACTPDLCNDTSVRAVVAYYLVKENDPGSIWCQPTGDCPKRIVRYLSHEPLEKFRGTRVYYDDGELKDSQKGTLDIDPKFTLDNPTADFPQVDVAPDVLVNYISDFSLLPIEIDPASGNEIYIPETNDSVKFTIKANARRRRDGSPDATEFCDPGKNGEGTAECPKASVRVQGLPVQF